MMALLASGIASGSTSNLNRHSIKQITILYIYYRYIMIIYILRICTALELIV